MKLAARWATILFVLMVLLPDAVRADDSEAISLVATFQFRNAKPLKGTLVNIGMLDALVDGTKISIPVIVVRRLDFPEGQDSVCYVTLANGSRIKCELPNQEFQVVVEWGEVQVNRANVSVIEFAEYEPPKEVTTWSPSSEDDKSP